MEVFFTDGVNCLTVLASIGQKERLKKQSVSVGTAVVFVIITISSIDASSWLPQSRIFTISVDLWHSPH